jgi:hypothetical protein
MIREIEANAQAERERTGRKPVGRERILRQSPFATPVNPRESSPAPLFHALGEILVRLLKAYIAFKVAFRQAAEMLRDGHNDAPFPNGSFPPAQPFVRAKPPPCATQPA